jgi:hypothetical protein
VHVHNKIKIRPFDSTSLLVLDAILNLLCYMERWININMHDSPGVSAKKHDKQNDSKSNSRDWHACVSVERDEPACAQKCAHWNAVTSHKFKSLVKQPKGGERQKLDFTRYMF